jgi:hypothetical protein
MIIMTPKMTLTTKSDEICLLLTNFSGLKSIRSRLDLVDIEWDYEDFLYYISEKPNRKIICSLENIGKW